MKDEMKYKKTLAIIPARGGSKRVPKKNIKNLDGEPLIGYTIEVANKSKYISDVHLSTDDEEIANVAEKYHCKIHDRPDYLGEDETPTIDVILDVLENFKKESSDPDIVILLQPTSPLRGSKDIDEAIDKFQDYRSKDKAYSLVSVCEFDEPPFWSFELKDDYLQPIFGEDYFEKRSQDLPDAYRPSGAIFISTPNLIREHKTFYTSKTIPYIMPKERSVDIDTEFDFKFAEFLMKKRNDNL